MFISLFPTPFDHFHFHGSAGLVPKAHSDTLSYAKRQVRLPSYFPEKGVTKNKQHLVTHWTAAASGVW